MTVRTGVAAAARCLALDQLAAEVITALQQAGIDVVLLKGAGLARRLYPENPGQRRYSDVDLLVSPATFELAGRVLTEAGLTDRGSGLREDELPWYERSWLLPGPASLVIDLHRSFVGVRDPEVFWEVISTSTETLDLSGITARVPDAAGCALIVGLHAAVPGPGNKPGIDLTKALALLPVAVWEQAAKLARQTRSTNAFARGLIGNPAGQAMVARLQLTSAGTLADDLLAHQAGWAAVGLAKLMDLPGPRAKLRFVARRLFASPSLMRLRDPVAARGGLGLAFAYVLRIRRAAAHAPGAVSAVRRARRTFERRPLPRHRRVLSALLTFGALDGADRLTCIWAVRTMRRARHQLATAPLADLYLPGPPAAGQGGPLTVMRVLAHRRASCMESTLVMQRWWAGQGLARDLLIGVTAPGDGFRAHAWLDDPNIVADPDLTEIHRRPPPPAWLATVRRV